jgi:hypothetical protein
VDLGLFLRVAAELACWEAANERRGGPRRRGPPLNPTTASVRLLYQASS